MTSATSSTRANWLIVAGEASGDRAGAAVVAQLSPYVRASAHAFGMGGDALAREGVELVADLRATTAMGVTEVMRRAWAIAKAFAAVRSAVVHRKPRAALLINYTAFNTHLAKWISGRGIRVLWYGAPQIWAWNPGRARSLRGHVTRMAVMLPFEEPLWQKAGIATTYVGHLALEERKRDRTAAREILGMTPFAQGVAIVPGSRPHEVRALLRPMLEGFELVRKEHASIDARVLLAPSLDTDTRTWARDQARSAGVAVFDVHAHSGLSCVLPAFDAALCASGTASLECALARAFPVVAYRVGWAAELGARALLNTKHVALPNILLGERVFPELLQADANAHAFARALTRTLTEREPLFEACDTLEAILATREPASRTVAQMLEPWLTDDAPRGGVTATRESP